MISTSTPTAGPHADPLRTHAKADTWFRLRSPQELPDQLRDLAHRELDLAAEGLWVSPGPALDAGVLYARSAVEKVRTLLRLVRAGIPKKVRKDHNGRLKALVRQLAEARDTGTLEDVVERLRQATREPELRDGLMVLGGRLAERRYRDSAAHRDGHLLSPIREELERLDAEVLTWPLEGDGFALLAPGLARVQRRAAKAMQKVADGKTSAKRHRKWMRRSRELGYAVRLLEPTWPCPLNALGHEIDRMSGRLQEADELDRLLRLAKADETLFAALPDDALVERVGRLRDRFRTEALLTGRRIFADSPDGFRNRVGCWYSAWSDEAGHATEN